MLLWTWHTSTRTVPLGACLAMQAATTRPRSRALRLTVGVLYESLKYWCAHTECRHPYHPYSSPALSRRESVHFPTILTLSLSGCALVEMASSTTVVRTVIVPERPGEPVVVRPWASGPGMAALGHMAHVYVNFEHLRLSGLALVVEPSFAAEVVCHPRLEKEDDDEVFFLSQKARASRRAPVAMFFIHATALEGTSSPFCSYLRDFNTRRLRCTPEGIVVIAGTYEPRVAAALRISYGPPTQAAEAAKTRPSVIGKRSWNGTLIGPAADGRSSAGGVSSTQDTPTRPRVLASAPPSSPVTPTSWAPEPVKSVADDTVGEGSPLTTSGSSKHTPSSATHASTERAPTMCGRDEPRPSDAGTVPQTLCTPEQEPSLSPKFTPDSADDAA